MKINQYIQSMNMQSKIRELNNPASNNVSENTSADRSITLLERQYNTSFTAEEKEGISQFLKEADGSESSKLQTVGVAISQNVELTKENLDSIHSALTESPLSADQIDTLLINQNDQPADMDAIIDSLNLPQDIKDAMKDVITKGGTPAQATEKAIKMIFENLSDDEMKTIISKVMKENGVAVSDAALNRALEAIKAIVKGDVTLENGLGKLMDAMGIDIETEGEVLDSKILVLQLMTRLLSETTVVNPTEDGGDDGQVESVIDEQNIETHPGLSHKDNQTTTQAVTAESDNLQTKDKDTDEAIAALIEDIEAFIDESVQAVDNQLVDLIGQVMVKMVAVTETTELTIALKNEFEAVKTEVTQTLEKAAEEDTKPAEVSKLVSDAIDKLNQTINKSDLTLYTSMKNERDLLIASSALQEAKLALASGDVKGALETVKETHQLVKSMQFKPELKRVEVFTMKQIENANEILRENKGQNDAKDIKALMQILTHDEGQKSARDVVETIRLMGNNHEVEVANQMDQKESKQKYELMNNNIKEILLKLSKEETDKRIVEETQQSLMNMSGQQMMGDSSSNQQRAFHFFNYPVEIDDEAQNMKIYISGKNNQSTLDWQNTELYFGLSQDTGNKTGISVKIVDGNITIKVLDDDYQTIESALESYGDELESLGFKSVKIQGDTYSDDVKPLPTLEKRQEVPKNEPVQTGGFDFKI